MPSCWQAHACPQGVERLGVPACFSSPCSLSPGAGSAEPPRPGSRPGLLTRHVINTTRRCLLQLEFRWTRSDQQRREAGTSQRGRRRRSPGSGPAVWSAWLCISPGPGLHPSLSAGAWKPGGPTWSMWVHRTWSFPLGAAVPQAFAGGGRGGVRRKVQSRIVCIIYL